MLRRDQGDNSMGTIGQSRADTGSNHSGSTMPAIKENTISHKSALNSDTTDANNNRNNGDEDDATNNIDKNNNNSKRAGGKNRRNDDTDDNDHSTSKDNIETQFQHQIQSQLRNQLQNELNQTFQENDEPENENEDVNILDTTNIDDELRNLESIAHNISKADVDAAVDDDDADAAAAAVVSFAQAAAANRLNGNDDDDDVVVGVVNNDVSVDVDVDMDAALADINAGLSDVHTGTASNGEHFVTKAGANDESLENQNGNNRTAGNDGSSKIDEEKGILKNMKFYLPVESVENENIVSMIAACGGEIDNKLDPQTLILIPNNDKPLKNSLNQYSYQFIYDTYLKKNAQDLNEYRVGHLTASADGETADESLKINVGDFPISRELTAQTEPAEQNPANDINKGKRRIIKNPNPITKRKSKKFTKEEDDFILDLVRRNPHLRSTHTFFARISQLEPLCGHTGNSIRYRYRKVLSPLLNYVYKIDPETGKPVLDPETNAPVQITEIPSLIKSQYTSEEDYLLCKHILSYKNGDMVFYGKKKQEISQIPEVVFQELNKNNPRHSTMSWRDRYRKFAAKFGLRRYISYYEDCLNQNIQPEPMKNMSSRADRKDYKVDVFENENKRPLKENEGEANKKSKIDIGKSKTVKSKTPMATKTGDSKSSKLIDEKSNEKSIVENMVDPLLTSDTVTNEEIVAAAAGALEELAHASLQQQKSHKADSAIETLKKEIESGETPSKGEIDTASDVLPSNGNTVCDKNESHNHNNSQNNRNENDTSNDLTDHTNNARDNADDKEVIKIAGTHGGVEQNDDGANLFVDATEDEMKQYDIALNNANIDVNTPKKKVNITTEDEDNEADVGSNNVHENAVGLINVKADDGLMDFRQLIEIDPEPLKHRDEIELNTMVRNIHTCFRNFGDGNTPYELFKDISDQTGISMLWLNYWFDCSCGMLGTFIQAIIHYLETGELVMNNVSGFWTEKDDELLKIDPENRELLQLHGKDSVTKRKAVLFSYVL